MNYLDFDLTLESLPGTPATYRARVLNSPAGQATVDFTLPFNAHELENYILKMGRLRRNVRSSNTQEGAAARDFGSRLYNAVFRDSVHDALRRSLDVADAKPNHGLRLRLRLENAPALLDLPWEYLYDPVLRRFFCHSVATPLVRYPEQPRPVTPLAVALPLQVLVMIANPSDVSTLDVEGEWHKVQNALAPLIAQGQVHLTRLPNATLAALQRQLRQGSYHIFHFVGHGGIERRSGERVLYLEDERGRARAVSGDVLGTLLNDHRSLRLAFLNACEGARVGADDPFAGVAQHLVLQGIPAIIAMQFEITDEAALILAHEFYAALADGYPVEAALAEARKAIFVAGNDVEWGTPVLYSRASDGYLFVLASTSSDDDHSTLAERVPPGREATVGLPARREANKQTSNGNPVERDGHDSENQQPTVTPSQQGDETPPSLAELSARPIVRDEERIAAEKTQAERMAASTGSVNDIATEAEPVEAAVPRPSPAKRKWWQIVVGLVALVTVGYLGLLSIDSYQRNQRDIAAAATQQAKYAAATAQAPVAQATATAIAQSVEAKMLQDVPQLRPLVKRFDMRFVEVPAGEFLMGSPDGIGYSDEYPQFMMLIDDAFWVGLTEVTNAQYQPFLDADGYANQAWWTAAGWQWKLDQNITQPMYWSDTQWNSAWQPVVGVSWYEATAYAAWLAAETGLAIRLPTEAEWEKAARGTDGQTYPWGNGAPTERLLNYNSNLGQTVAVGSYPAGASPYGAFDMASNVWEWNATQWVENYANYAIVVDDEKVGDARRVLRGGSWENGSNNVRSANRVGNDPDYRNYNIGFRVVFAPGF